MTEEWRAVDGFDGYEVSDLGRIRSWLMQGRGTKRLDVPRVLVQQRGSNGYRKVGLRRDGATVQFSVHRLIAAAFVGNREAGNIVCHNDSDKENNSADNLRWDTQTENLFDASRLGRAPRQVLNEALVREIRQMYEAGGCTHRSLAKQFGVTNQSIRALIQRKNYRWVA